MLKIIPKLTFNLKKECFEKIKSGEKTHEYRKFNYYWNIRIIDNLFPKDFICFACGYPSKTDKNKRLLATVLKVTITDGLHTDLKIDEPVWDINFKILPLKRRFFSEDKMIDRDLIGREQVYLINDSFQNRKQYNIPKAQLVIADIPYNVDKNAYASQACWYKDNDIKNGQSEKANKQFFETDKNFNLHEFFHFCSKLLKPNRKRQTRQDV